MSIVPFKATRVVKAVDDSLLPCGLKAVFLEMYGLDNGPMGCTATATRLALRLGLSPRTVDDARRELVALGLAYKVSGSNGWHVTMPADCVPVADRPTDQDVHAAALKLTAFLRPDPEIPAQGRGARGRILVQERGESPSRGGGVPAQERGFEKPSSPSANGDSEADPPRQGDVTASLRLERLEKLDVNPPTSPPPTEVGRVAVANPQVGQPQRFADLLPPHLRDEFQRWQLRTLSEHLEGRLGARRGRP